MFVSKLKTFGLSRNHKRSQFLGLSNIISQQCLASLMKGEYGCIFTSYILKINPPRFSKVYHLTIVLILERTYLNKIHKCGAYAPSKCL